MKKTLVAIIALFAVVGLVFVMYQSSETSNLRQELMDNQELLNILQEIPQSSTLNFFKLTKTKEEHIKKVAQILFVELVHDKRRFWLVARLILQFFDANHDGKLTFVDVQNRVKSILHKTPFVHMALQQIAPLEQWMQRLDLDRSGDIGIYTEGKMFVELARQMIIQQMTQQPATGPAKLEMFENSQKTLSIFDDLRFVSADQKFIDQTEVIATMMINFQDKAAEMKFYKTLAKQVVSNLVKIVMLDPILYRQIVKFHFDFQDSNGDGVVDVQEVMAFYKHICHKVQCPDCKKYMPLLKQRVLKHFAKFNKVGSATSMSWKLDVLPYLEVYRKKQVAHVKLVFQKYHIPW